MGGQVHERQEPEQSCQVLQVVPEHRFLGRVAPQQGREFCQIVVDLSAVEVLLRIVDHFECGSEVDVPVQVDADLM